MVLPHMGMTITLAVLSQVAIGLLGVASMMLVTSKEEALRRIAAPIALLAEPFWFYTAYVNEQWGILLLTFIYTVRWGQVFYRDWVRGK